MLYGSSHKVIIQLQLISNTIKKSLNLQILLNSSYIIRHIFCNFFVIKYKKVFLVFPTASFNDLIYTDINAFCFTTRSRLTTMRRKINSFIHNEDIFILIRLIVYLWKLLSLNGFLSVIMSWSVVNPSCLLRLEIYSLRHAITYT